MNNTWSAKLREYLKTRSVGLFENVPTVHPTCKQTNKKSMSGLASSNAPAQISVDVKMDR